MLIKEETLRSNRVDSILESAVCLTEAESTLYPAMIPVIENGRLSANLVRFDDLTRLVENHFNCGYLDTLNMVSEANGIDLSSIKVAINDYELIENAEIANGLINEGIDFVVAPISETNPVYVVMEAVVDAYAVTGDEDLLEYMAMAEATWGSRDYRKFKNMGSAPRQSSTKKSGYMGGDSEIKKSKHSFGNVTRNAYSNLKQAASDTLDKAKDVVDNAASSSTPKDVYNKTKKAIKENPGKAAAVGAAAALGVAGLYKALGKTEQQAESKPKSWISQKIAALRALYSKWLEKANKETDAGKASSLKNVAAKIMNVIDRLMKKLQTATE